MIVEMIKDIFDVSIFAIKIIKLYNATTQPAILIGTPVNTPSKV